ncbi:MAG: rhomboid family intramembrane serine protease [Myxococcota bacterium]
MRTSMPRGGTPTFDLRPTPIVLRLLIANFAIWMLFSILVNFAGASWALSLYRDLALQPTTAILDLHVWQIGTYMWLHDLSGGGHIIFNLLGLFFLGPPLERRWGPKAFLVFYLAAGLIAGLVTVLAGLLIPSWFDVPVVGASGSIMALLAAFSFTMPSATILLFFVIPVQARWIVWIAVGIDTVMFFSSPGGGLAYHTHLGGVLGAWLLITGTWRPRLLKDRVRLLWLRARKRGLQRRKGFRVIDGGRGGGDRDRYLH